MANNKPVPRGNVLRKLGNAFMIIGIIATVLGLATVILSGTATQLAPFGGPLLGIGIPLLIAGIVFKIVASVLRKKGPAQPKPEKQRSEDEERHRQEREERERQRHLEEEQRDQQRFEEQEDQQYEEQQEEEQQYEEEKEEEQPLELKSTADEEEGKNGKDLDLDENDEFKQKSPKEEVEGTGLVLDEEKKPAVEEEAVEEKPFQWKTPELDADGQIVIPECEIEDPFVRAFLMVDYYRFTSESREVEPEVMEFIDNNVKDEGQREYLRGYYHPRTEEGTEHFRKGHEAGNFSAKLQYGIALYKGDGCAKDYNLARQVLKDLLPENGVYSRKYAAQHADEIRSAFIYLNNVGYPNAESKDRTAYLLELAKTGELMAKYELGYIYENGDLGTADPLKALKIYEECARAGHSVCLGKIGHLYLTGSTTFGISIDYAKAAEYFYNAARLGSSSGVNGLEKLNKIIDEKGIELEFGENESVGDGEQQEEEFEFVEPARDRNGRIIMPSFHGGDLYRICQWKNDFAASLYKHPEAYQKRTREENVLFIRTKLEETGDPAFYGYLYDAYDNKKQLEERLAVAKEGYEAGDIRSAVNLAVCYYRGQGVPVDKEKAAQIFEEILPESGKYDYENHPDYYAEAATATGLLGDIRGSTEIGHRAHDYYEEGEARGSVVCVARKAPAYQFGTSGYPKDPAKAWEYLTKAADLGNPWAIFRLGMILEKDPESFGQEQDLEAAAYYYYNAILAGYFGAKEYLENLKKEIEQ